MGFDELRELTVLGGHEIQITQKSGGRPGRLSPADIIVAIDEQDFANHIGKKIRRSAHHRFVINLARGDFDKMKQEALYADFCDDGSLRDPIKRIDRSKAEKLIRLAGGAIHQTKMTFRYATALAAKRSEQS